MPSVIFCHWKYWFQQTLRWQLTQQLQQHQHQQRRALKQRNNLLGWLSQWHLEAVCSLLPSVSQFVLWGGILMSLIIIFICFPQMPEGEEHGKGRCEQGLQPVLHPGGGEAGWRCLRGCWHQWLLWTIGCSYVRTDLFWLSDVRLNVDQLLLWIWIGNCLAFYYYLLTNKGS